MYTYNDRYQKFLYFCLIFEIITIIVITLTFIEKERSFHLVFKNSDGVLTWLFVELITSFITIMYLGRDIIKNHF